MTTAYMETVSLNDDVSVASSTSSTSLDVDSLEAQFASSSVLMPSKDAIASPEIVVPVSDSDSDEYGDNRNKYANLHSMEPISDPINRKKADDLVVVDVNGDDKGSNSFSTPNGNKQHVLPPLRVMTQNLSMDERDYVDKTLFSPEVSRHAMEVAHRRAKAIAAEVKEIMELEVEVGGPAKAKMSPAEAVGIIGNAFASSLQRAKKFVKPGTKEYDLLSGTSPSGGMSKLDDLDTGGDGLQLSPDTIQDDKQHFRMPKLKPALKRISAYSTAAALEPEKKLSSTRLPKKKRVLWHEDVLDADEEFYEDDSDGQETSSLMNADGDAASSGNGSPRPQLLNFGGKSGAQFTPQSRKKRKKIVRSMMRRLTPREKEELYRQRPDLMIVPNWAQKYREELAGDSSAPCNVWLLGLIMIVAVLLLVFVLLIVRKHADAAT